MTLSGDEFIRRFLLHVLPDGLQRIRYYGLLASRSRARRLAQARALLLGPRPELLPGAPQLAEVVAALPKPVIPCPHCQRGVMVRVAVMVADRRPAPRRDTS